MLTREWVEAHHGEGVRPSEEQGPCLRTRRHRGCPFLPLQELRSTANGLQGNSALISGIVLPCSSAPSCAGFFPGWRSKVMPFALNRLKGQQELKRDAPASACVPEQCSWVQVSAATARPRCQARSDHRLHLWWATKSLWPPAAGYTGLSTAAPPPPPLCRTDTGRLCSLHLALLRVCSARRGHGGINCDDIRPSVQSSAHLRAQALQRRGDRPVTMRV